jgi:cysteine-S-conjugate beta-lyase
VGLMLPHRTTIYTIRCEFPSTQCKQFFLLYLTVNYTSQKTARKADNHRVFLTGSEAWMSKSWKTKLIHSDAKIPEGYRSLASPTFRGSTTLFPSASAVTDNWDQWRAGYTYGVYGTPTVMELAARVCELESGSHTILTPGGQAAISLINFALLQSGDHLLVPASVYYPNRKLATRLLSRFGITTDFYDPGVGAKIGSLIQDNTRLIWCESPGSITMEIQDLPAIVAAAHERNVNVVLDNTWSAGVLLDAFSHGVDVTMQAITKYIGGHSDLLLGSITIRDDALYQRLGAAQQVIGCAVSPDDCSLALRGLQTLAVRLSAIESSALSVARWLSSRREIELVLHPALPSCPGHEFWKRDFLGSSGVFSIVLRHGPTQQQVHAFVDELKLFGVGYSWGGVASLAVAYNIGRLPGRPPYEHRIVRLNIGLEATDDLIADLEQALPKLNASNS